MAFDLHGLICAQMAASLTYAEDQDILLDDYEHRITTADGRYLDAEITFEGFTGNPFQSGTIRINTLFQQFVYEFCPRASEVTLRKEMVGDKSDPQLSYEDRLKLLSLAIEASTR